MDRLKLDYFIDLGLFVSFLLVFVTGVIKYRPFGLHEVLSFPGIRAVHDLSGIVMGILVLVHLFLHWEWIVNTTKCLFKKEEEVCEDKPKK